MNKINKIINKIKSLNKNTVTVNQPVIDNYIKNYKKNNKLKIDFVIPQPIIGSGGHRNIYRIIRYLSQKGYKVTAYIDPEGLWSKDHIKTGMEAYKKITKNFFDLECNIIFGVDNIASGDVLFATHSESAYIVNQNIEKFKLGCYFIQDFECYFSPMGDNYIRAYNTYKLGLYPITSGPWPLEMLKKEFGITKGSYFRFPINKDIYYYDDKIMKNNQIIFFAKPSMPRRCYDLGINALKLVKEKRPDIKIVFYGEDDSHYKNLPFEFENRGLVPTIEDLANLYRSSTIGIAFSTTNPSLVPYEMMACGVAVIDLNFNNSIVSYDSRENISLVNTTPLDIAEGILKLYDDEKFRTKQVQNALTFCEKFPSEKEMCELIEKYIITEYKNRGRKNK